MVLSSLNDVRCIRGRRWDAEFVGQGWFQSTVASFAECCLRLVEASLRLGEDHAEGYDDGEDNGDRDREKQEDIEEEIYCGTVFWVEPSS